MTYIDQVIISHNHPMNIGSNMDELYRVNEAYYRQDEQTFKKRKEQGFPVSSIYESQEPKRFVFLLSADELYTVVCDGIDSAKKIMKENGIVGEPEIKTGPLSSGHTQWLIHNKIYKWFKEHAVWIPYEA